jgi:hypothetical protein
MRRQWCWRIVSAPIDTVFQALLETYGQIPAAHLNLAGWATEVGTYRSAYLLDALISIPTPVVQLGDEPQEQTLVNLWWMSAPRLLICAPFAASMPSRRC